MKNEFRLRFIFKLLICTYLILFSLNGSSQNIIYLENSLILGKVVDISAEEIKYKRLDNFEGPIYKTNRNKVLLLFNEMGGYLIIGKLDSISPIKANNLINRFLKPSIKNPDLDILLTVDNKPVICSIIDEDSLLYYINYNNINFQKSKSLVAVVIYKNGKHRIVSDLKTAINALDNFEKIKSPKTNMPNSKILTPTQNNSKPKKNEGEKTIDKEYKALISEAQQYLENEDYENSKSFYLQAAELKPNDQALKERLDSINNLIIYDSLVRSAGKCLSRENFDSALIIYKKILELKSDDIFASMQMEYVNEQLAKKSAEEEIRRKKEIDIKNREIEKRYRNAISKADELKLSGDYKGALNAYLEASAIHPEDEYVKKNIETLTYHLKKSENKQD